MSPRPFFVAATMLLYLLGCANEKNEKHTGMNVNNFEVATLGAGCFWCVEAVFTRLNGVEKVESGYSGGKIANPTYGDVCSGITGHAEVVQITFNPNIIPYAKILEIFFQTHDPTTLNRQGADVGTQYRSAIFYHSDEQKRVANEVKQMLDRSGIWNSPIATEISPFTDFYKAENYHQDYFANNNNQPYCQMIIVPKIAKFEKLFKDYLKK
jgi:peptide-methionine (S)-S-oxide reductase